MQVTLLNNGVRVATQKTSGAAAHVRVCVDVGSRFENSDYAGACNLIALSAFNGTVANPGKSFGAKAAAIGAKLEAEATREHSFFSATVPGSNVTDAVNILGDAVANMSLEEASLNSLKEKVSARIDGRTGFVNSSDKEMQEIVLDNLHATAFGNNGLGRSVLGDGPSRDSLLSFKANHFTPNRMVVVGTGNVDHASFVEAVSKNFNQKHEDQHVYREAPVFTGSDIRVRFDSFSKAYIAIGYPTAGACDESNVTLKVASQLLGDWEYPQPLVQYSQAVLDANHDSHGRHADKIQALNCQYQDTGLFGLYCVASNPYGVLALSNNMMDSLTRLSYEIDPVKLAEAKSHLKRVSFTGLDNCEHVGATIGKQMLHYGRRIHPVEYLARLEAVDAGAIKLVARRFLNDKCHALSAVGSIYELQDYNFFRRKSYWLQY